MGLPPQESAAASSAIKRRAADLGFTMQGICPAVGPPGADRLGEWLARGYAGDMHYLAERRDAYEHPTNVLDGVRSILMLTLPYSTAPARSPRSTEGRVSRYAWGEVDYHNLIRDRLHQLADYLRELAPDAVTRGVVDTAPLLEREFAQLSGLGWIGKHTLLLNRTAGSYFFLAALLTDVELDYDAPHAADHCGTCTACLDACPTDAFPQPYVLDATRCISYLTIEHRGPIPVELRPGVGEWLFGCDVCQDVCPWNRGKSNEPVAELQPDDALNPVDCTALFDMTEEDFRRRFRQTPLWRAHRRGLLRNAAVVLGNLRHRDAAASLIKGLWDDEPLIRGASAWALGRLEIDEAFRALQQRARVETNAEVSREIAAALDSG